MKPAWQPIEGYDKAIHPLDVLVATDHGVGEARQHDDGAYGRWFWANTCDDGAPGPGEIYPTHWMPLPDPPALLVPLPPEAPQSMTDAAEMLWIVLANVSGGDWTQQTPDWQEAAARWRDNYFAALRAVAAAPVPQERG